MSNQKYKLPKAVVEQLTKDAQEVFDTHPKETKLYATINGSLFFEKEKGSALDAAKKLKQDELIVITKGEELPVEEEAAVERPVVSIAAGKYKDFTEEQLLEEVLRRKDAGRTIEESEAKTAEQYIALLEADDKAAA